MLSYAAPVIDVVIPPDRLAAVQGHEFTAWILANTSGSVIGRIVDGAYVLSFSKQAEADAFSARWLSDHAPA